MSEPKGFVNDCNISQTFDNCLVKFWRWHRPGMLRAATSTPPLQPTSKMSKTSSSESHSSNTKQRNHILTTLAFSAPHAKTCECKTCLATFSIEFYTVNTAWNLFQFFNNCYSITLKIKRKQYNYIPSLIFCSSFSSDDKSACISTAKYYFTKEHFQFIEIYNFYLSGSAWILFQFRICRCTSCNFVYSKPFRMLILRTRNCRQAIKNWCVARISLQEV